jgi:hypothetical protein
MKKTLSPQVKRLALDIMRAIGTPLAGVVSNHIEKGEWDTIAKSKVDPRVYTDGKQYFLDAIVVSLLRKYSDLPTTFDRRAAALDNWRLGEADCYKTNERLNPYLEGFSHPSWNADVARHIDGIRDKIRSVLGRAPSMESLSPRHGPGATFSDKSVRSTLADKMQAKASITSGALWFLLDWVGTAWGRESLKRAADPVFVRGNRFTVAPKDAVKDRPIAAEPSINIFYQLGLGRAIRQRLTNVGIDLDYGQETHRLQACEASKTGFLATLDLKNASDTVSYNLVKLLMPADWFRLLDELRSPYTRMGLKDLKVVATRVAPSEGSRDRWLRLEKFSSMGNGFTFELESLLFWAISDYACSQACADDGWEGKHQTLVYGDDIICDSRGVHAVLAALRFFGFTANEEKSFWFGGFRESCGGDFWDGRPVRPYFLKDPLDEPQNVIAAANQIRRLDFDLSGGLNSLRPVWLALLDQLPSRIRRCRGPETLGDVVIHDEESSWSWTSSAKDRILCYRPVRTRKVSFRNFSEGVVLACGLYGVPVSPGYLMPRDAVLSYEVRRVVPYGVRWVPTLRIRKALASAPIPLPPFQTGRPLTRVKGRSKP